MTKLTAGKPVLTVIRLEKAVDIKVAPVTPNPRSTEKGE
jgi:hypothetical protein